MMLVPAARPPKCRRSIGFLAALIMPRRRRDDATPLMIIDGR